MDRKKLETVTSFEYLGSLRTDEGSKPEILSRITVVQHTILNSIQKRAGSSKSTATGTDTTEITLREGSFNKYWPSGQTTVNKRAPIHCIIPINDMVHRPL